MLYKYYCIFFMLNIYRSVYKFIRYKNDFDLILWKILV